MVHRFLAMLIACFFPQFLSAARGQWWLFIAIGVVIFFIYKKPELYGRKGLERALIFAQSANLIGGISWLYLVEYRSQVTLTWAVIMLLFPIGYIMVLAYKIYVENKKSIAESS